MTHTQTRSARGFSLLEVMICLVILAFTLVPIVDMFSNSHRISHSSQRLVQVSLHGQMLIEAVAMMNPEDLPTIPVDAEVTLLSDDLGGVGGGGPQFASLNTFFQKPPPFKMQRTLTGRRLPTGELLVRIKMEWLGVAQEDSTHQEITLRMLSAPRNWQ